MRYKEYKKVGIPWLDEVPSHWEIQRIANVFDIRKEKNDPIKTEEVLSLSAKYGVTPYSEKKEKGGNKPKSDLTKYNLCYQGDILVNCMNVVAGAVGISNYFGAVSPVYYPLVTNKYNNKYYMEYLFRNYDFQRGMVGLGKGIMMNESESGNLTTVRMRISWDTLKTLEVPVPPKEEQEQIARFLDWKINEIYRLISIREKQIKNLEKTRRIVTIDTMLNNDYKSVMLSRCASENKRRNTNSNQNLLSLSYGKIIRKDINSTFGLLPEKFDKYQLVDKGNIILRLTDLQNDHKSLRVGLVKEKGIITSAYIGLICNDMVIPEYLYYYLNAMDLRKDFYSMGAGVRQNLNYNELRKINIKLPDKDTQKYIIDYLNENENRIKKIIKIKEKQINNLKQLKQSLISDVVTGKIDVRNVSIPEYNKVNNMEDDAILDGNFNEGV